MRKSTAMVGAAALGAALAVAGVPAAHAHVVNANGTYTVTATELRSAFGSGVDLAAVTFEAEGGGTVYLVPCQKTVGKKGKVITHDFRRHSTVNWNTASVAVTDDSGAITGFTVTVTKLGENTSKVKCPTAFSPRPATVPVVVKTRAVELVATWGDEEVELPVTVG